MFTTKSMPDEMEEVESENTFFIFFIKWILRFKYLFCFFEEIKKEEGEPIGEEIFIPCFLCMRSDSKKRKNEIRKFLIKTNVNVDSFTIISKDYCGLLIQPMKKIKGK